MLLTENGELHDTKTSLTKNTTKIMSKTEEEGEPWRDSSHKQIQPSSLSVQCSHLTPSTSDGSLQESWEVKGTRAMWPGLTFTGICAVSWLLYSKSFITQSSKRLFRFTSLFVNHKEASVYSKSPIRLKINANLLSLEAFLWTIALIDQS